MDGTTVDAVETRQGDQHHQASVLEMTCLAQELYDRLMDSVLNGLELPMSAYTALVDAKNHASRILFDLHRVQRVMAPGGSRGHQDRDELGNSEAHRTGDACV